ncbi:MAG: hypothetical protein J0M08_01560 [Bacteroidetes bacterium]|nr:hypothetical protein [Bacteroidota bacterium]
MRNLVGVSIVFFLLFFSCKKDGLETIQDNGPCDSSVATYNTIVKPIIVAKCATGTACHSPGFYKGNFNNYSTVKSKVTNKSFYNRVFASKTSPMPPVGSKYGALTKCEKALIRKWLDEGAQNN